MFADNCGIIVAVLWQHFVEWCTK